MFLSESTGRWQPAFYGEPLEMHALCWQTQGKNSGVSGQSGQRTRATPKCRSPQRRDDVPQSDQDAGFREDEVAAAALPLAVFFPLHNSKFEKFTWRISEWNPFLPLDLVNCQHDKQQ
jgi:hypothetical protein